MEGTVYLVQERRMAGKRELVVFTEEWSEAKPDVRGGTWVSVDFMRRALAQIDAEPESVPVAP